VLQPENIFLRRPDQLKAADLKRLELELIQSAAGGIKSYGVQKSEVVPVVLVTGDPLIIVQKIPTAV
jgi:hypothetical protein